MTQYKTCTKCSQTQALDAFSKNKLGKNGLRSACKNCNNLAYKAWSQSNLQSLKDCRALRRKEARIYGRKYYEINSVSIKAGQKKWRQNNLEVVALRAHKRRVSERLGGVYIIYKQELKKIYSSPCAYCAAPSEHIDHIVPISRGGTHSIGNLTGACASCNLSKGAKFITEWKKGK